MRPWLSSRWPPNPPELDPMSSQIEAETSRRAKHALDVLTKLTGLVHRAEALLAGGGKPRPLTDNDVMNDAATSLNWAEAQLGVDGQPMRLPDAIIRLAHQLETAEAKTKRREGWVAWLGMALVFAALWGIGNQRGEQHYRAKLEALECAIGAALDEQGSLVKRTYGCANG